MWPWAYLSATGKRFGGFSERTVAALSVPSQVCSCTLPLRYCAVRFASEVPTRRLPVPGHAAGLVTADDSVADVVEVEAGGEEVAWISGSGSGRKRIRLNRKKTLHTSLVFWELNLGHVCGRDCVMRVSLWKLLLTTRGDVLISRMRVLFLVITGQGLDNSWGSTCPRLQACILRISQVAVCTRDVECIYTHIIWRPEQQHRSHFDSILPQNRVLVLTMAQRYNLFPSVSENEGSSSGDIAPAVSHVALALVGFSRPAVSYVAPAPARGVGPAVFCVVCLHFSSDPQCPTLFLRPRMGYWVVLCPNVAPALVHLYDAAVSYVAPALVDGFFWPCHVLSSS